MDPHLHGFLILYAANLLWSGGFAAWGFAAGVGLRAPVFAVLFVGPRLARWERDGSRFDLRAIPFPSSSVASAYAELDAEVVGREQRLGHAMPASLAAPFGGASFGRRAIVLLVPYAFLAGLVVLLNGPDALTRIPVNALTLLRGALSPLGTGTEIARGFLRDLGEAPLGEALGQGLRVQLAFTLLPIWGGLWSTLLFVGRRSVGWSPAWTRVATFGTLLGLAILGAWGLAIVRALV